MEMGDNYHLYCLSYVKLSYTPLVKTLEQVLLNELYNIDLYFMKKNNLQCCLHKA